MKTVWVNLNNGKVHIKNCKNADVDSYIKECIADQILQPTHSFVLDHPFTKRVYNIIEAERIVDDYFVFRGEVWAIYIQIILSLYMRNISFSGSSKKWKHKVVIE